MIKVHPLPVLICWFLLAHPGLSDPNKFAREYYHHMLEAADADAKGYDAFQKKLEAAALQLQRKGKHGMRLLFLRRDYKKLQKNRLRGHGLHLMKQRHLSAKGSKTF